VRDKSVNLGLLTFAVDISTYARLKYAEGFDMSSPGKIIRSQLKKLEIEAGVLLELRELAKTPGGRLSEFGISLISASQENEVKQSFVARLLDIDPAAVSRRYNA